MKLNQTKSDTSLSFVFEKYGLKHFVKDKQSSSSVFVPYEDITNEQEYYTESNTWFFNVGILWLIIGLFQIFISFSAGQGFSLPIWIVLGIICVATFYIKRIKYTYIPVPQGKIFIIQNNQHDEILSQIYKNRNEYLRENYLPLSEDYFDQKDREIAKYERLLELEVISKEEFEKLKTIIKSNKKMVAGFNI